MLSMTRLTVKVRPSSMAVAAFPSTSRLCATAKTKKARSDKKPVGAVIAWPRRDPNWK